MQCCHICGNEIDAAYLSCPFCGSDQKSIVEGQSQSHRNIFSQKTINLEKGFPTVAQALDRLQRAISTSHQERIRVLTLIHGYGSSGKGGAIRRECRKTLDYLYAKGEIADVVTGEDFNRRHGKVRNLLNCFAELAHHPYLDRRNKGITLIVLPKTRTPHTG